MTANVNAKNDMLNIFRVKSGLDKQKEKLGFELGELIFATITSQSNGKTQLTTRDNFSFEADSAQIIGNIGDELKFEVMKAGNNELTLKQLISRDADFGQTMMQLKSAADVKELFKQNGMLNDEKMFKDSKARNEEAENERKEAQAIAKIRRQITYATTDVNINTMGELIASGVSLSKINLSVLNSVMKEINVKPHLKVESELAKASAGESSGGLGKPLGKYAEALNMNEKEIINVLKKVAQEDKALTLENIYRAKHATANLEKNTVRKKGDPEPISAETLDSLEPEILRVLESCDLPQTDEYTDVSKKLISNDIALTKQNITKFLFLKNLDAAMLESILDSVHASIAKNSDNKNSNNENNINDINIYGINLFEAQEENNKTVLFKNYNEIIKSLPQVGTANIQLLLKQLKPITLNNLKNTVGAAELSGINSATDAESTELTAAKRQLTGIMLKLTHEAAMRLAGKSIAIDSSPLAEALAMLKKQEVEGYASNLRAMGAPANEANIGTMNELYERLPAFASVSQNELSNVVNNVMNNKLMFNVTNTSDAINEIRTVNVSNLYEYNITPSKTSATPSTLDKQLSAFLNNMGLDASEKNLKAAKILYYNRMEISAEALSQVKLVEAKIDRIYNTLHPSIAANMIKEGLNPLLMHVDEMLEYTDKFNDIYGEDLGDKIASFIMQMDNNASYTDEERQGIIAIYKMLNTMQNHGGAGLGQIVKNKTPMTLGYMMESAKLYKSTIVKNRKFDYLIDDETDSFLGSDTPSSIKNAIEKAVMLAKEQIRKDRIEQLETEKAQAGASTGVSMGVSYDTEAHMQNYENNRVAALLEKNNMAETLENLYMAEANKGEDLSETAYAALNLKNITDNAQPELLRNLIDMNQYKDMSIFDIAEFLQKQMSEYSQTSKQEQQAELTQAYAGRLEQLAEASPQIIKWMSDNNIGTSIESILTMLEMSKDSFFLSKKLDKLTNAIEQETLENTSWLNEALEDGETAGFENEVFETDLSGLESTADIKDRLDKIDYKLWRMSTEAQSAKLMEQLNSAREAIKLQNGIMASRDGNEYHIPIKLHDKISGLNMRFLNNNNEADNILLSLDTNALGKINVYVRKSGDKLMLDINAENDASVSFLRENTDALLSYVKQSGFAADNVEINCVKNN